MASVFYSYVADGKVVPIALVWPRSALVLPYSGPQGLRLRSWGAATSWCGYLRLRGSKVHHEEYETLSSWVSDAMVRPSTRTASSLSSEPGPASPAPSL